MAGISNLESRRTRMKGRRRTRTDGVAGARAKGEEGRTNEEDK